MQRSPRSSDTRAAIFSTLLSISTL
ncbi:hypothetical protein E2C01_069328 [Portunus trituberculatus]|uniref:Uncharacterized protein n=1 Tax=Portunus trituberculatus TaxID=210409 RepID=A0A5B7HYL5_PORTR|nr:hypothetical protein [Portunus trituberculatus]